MARWLLAAGLVASVMGDCETEYKQFLSKFPSKSGSPEPERLAIFCANLARVEEHNSGNGIRSWSMGINEFSDWTSDEKKVLLGWDMDDNSKLTQFKPPATLQLVSSVDWRSRMPGVKNQKHCGSCWAFSAIDVVDFEAGGSHSEQQVDDCSGAGSCGGGNPYRALQYLSNAGSASESYYPYQGQDGSCKSFQPTARVSNVQSVSGASDIASALQEHVVSVCFKLSGKNSPFMGYDGGVYDSDCGTGEGHCVAAVGYGSDYWIIRNSWGSNWGEQGYIRFKRGSNLCGMESHGTIAAASSVGPSPGPAPGPQPASKYTVGEHVEGLYKDGYWYAATIAKINSDGTYTVQWADGGTEDTVKSESKIVLAWTVGEQVQAKYTDGYWYAATIAKINSDGTFTIAWADGSTSDTVKPNYKIRPSSSSLKSSKYTVGEQVEALYKDGLWYGATIAKINSDGTYTLAWADGGTEDLVKSESKVLSAWTVGEQVEAKYTDGYWYAATIAKIHSDGTYTIAWADGSTSDTVKPDYKIRPSSSPSPSPSPSPGPTPSASDASIYIIRHGEKNSYGDLSSIGQARAKCIATKFPSSEYNKPTALFAGHYGGSTPQRTLHTIQPTADNLGLSVDDSISNEDHAGAASAFLAEVAKGKIVMAAWEHCNIRHTCYHLAPQSMCDAAFTTRDVSSCDWWEVCSGCSDHYDGVVTFTVKSGKVTAVGHHHEDCKPSTFNASMVVV